MRRLLLLPLLLAPALAGADEARLQVSATILSRCQFSASRVDAGAGAVTMSVARCNGAGANLPFRVSGDGITRSGALSPNVATTIATTRNGQVLTIEL